MNILKSAVLAAIAFAGAEAAWAQSPGDAMFNQVERGRYLATAGDCAACHTAPGGTPFAGGLTMQTPFGNLVTPNITPDMQTGIGKYTLEEFQRVMAEGVGRGGHNLYGAMPFTAYTKVTPEDNAAIFAYLKTLQPVSHKVEVNQLPFPFDQRWSLYAWNYLNFEPGVYKPDPARSEEWNRGAYLVQGLAHCGTCHTPKTLLGGEETGQWLEGYVLENWNAPNITPDKHKGIGSWSVEDIVAYLKTGANRFDLASGPMAEVIEKSTQHMTDQDLKAIAIYLKDSGGKVEENVPAPLAATEPVMKAGAAVFADRCEGCHMTSGDGVPKLFPKLSSAPLVNADDPTSLIHVVLAGSRPGATDAVATSPSMPSFAWNMSDADVASVLTFVRNTWGNSAPKVEPDDVKKLRDYLQQ